MLDLDSFGGGYPAALNEVADALGRVRASGKPVLAYATAYTDGGYRLASNAIGDLDEPDGRHAVHAGRAGSSSITRG